MQLSIFVSPTRRERTVVVEEVLYTFGVVVLVRFSYGPRVPGRFGGFVQVFEALSTLNNARILIICEFFFFKESRKATVLRLSAT